MVLWFPHKKDRARIVSKLLTIGEVFYFGPFFFNNFFLIESFGLKKLSHFNGNCSWFKYDYCFTSF